MRPTEFTRGREFFLVMDHGEDFFATLNRFCAEQEIRSGYISMLLGRFRTARLVGSCRPLKDPEAPLWEEIEVGSLEVHGDGTLAWDTERDCLAPHNSRLGRPEGGLRRRAHQPPARRCRPVHHRAGHRRGREPASAPGAAGEPVRRATAAFRPDPLTRPL